MNSDKFLEILADKEVLSERLIAKLRDKVDEMGGDVPAAALAKFLIQKKHLSQTQVAALLSDPLDDEPDTNESAILLTKLVYGDEPAIQIPATEATSVNEVPQAPPRELPPQTAGVPPTAPPAADPGPTGSKPEVVLRASSRSLRSDAIGKKKGAATETSQAALQERRSKKRSKAKRGNEWDSPLLLIGGGSLVLMVLCGTVVWYLLFRETGDEQLQLARTALQEGSYSQAVAQYEKFLERFENHPEQSSARVELGMARLRRATESGSNYVAALNIAQEEINEIQREPSFNEAQDELAALLPQIATALAERADTETELSKVGSWVQAASDALALCANSKYIPKKLRDETELGEVRDTLDRVQRRQKSYDDLQATVTRMQAAIDAGDTREAYEQRLQLLQANPQLANDRQLVEMVKATSLAEQTSIQLVEDQRAAETSERPSPLVGSLALAHHRGGQSAQADGQVWVLVDGGLYGLAAPTGRVIWRRFVGFQSTSSLVRVGNDVLVRDALHNDLLRIDGATGKLRWRQQLESPFAPPLVVNQRAYLATESGRLVVVDVANGTNLGHVKFAQPLRMTPTADRRGQFLYLIGDHSSIYVLSTQDLSCAGVYFLGHATGSIKVPPVFALSKLLVAENHGSATSRLHVLSVIDGKVSGTVAQERLDGLVQTTPRVAGRRVVVLTDRGQLSVYEVSPQDDASALTTVATRQGRGSRALVRYAMLTKGNVWVADDRLTRYAVQPSGNRLPVHDLPQSFEGSTFDHPLQVVGDALVHVRRPAGRRGATVAALELDSGRPLWEADLAVPPAGAPVIHAGANTLLAANANGFVFSFDRAAIQRRIQDQPLAARNAPTRPPVLTESVDLGDGRAAFSSNESAPWVLLHDPSQSASPLRWQKMPSPVACRPTAFGGGLLVPLEVGQVFHIDSATGASLAAPFQPRLAPRARTRWWPAATLPGSARQFVIADRGERLLRIELRDDSKPQLMQAAAAPSESYRFDSPAVPLAGAVYAASADGKLVAFRLPTFELAGTTNLPGRVIWGPHPVGEHLILATDNDELLGISDAGQVAWQIPLAHGQLVGAPLAEDATALLAWADGQLQRIDVATGQTLATVAINQPLAAGPVRFDKRILLTAHDGTLLVVDQP